MNTGQNREDINLKETSSFELKDFLTPGWQGHSLPSDLTHRFLKFITVLEENIQIHLAKNIHCFPERLKKLIWDDFNLFLEVVDSNAEFSYSDFWKMMLSPEESESELFQNFYSIYIKRVAILHTLKVKLALKLKDNNSSFDFHLISNPNTLLSRKIRTKNNILPIESLSLAPNQYTWYRVPQSLQSNLMPYLKGVEALNLADLSRYCSTIMGDFSHTQSHISFGKFNRQLITHFKSWAKTRSILNFKETKNTPPVSNLLIAGDYIESLSVSHWLSYVGETATKTIPYFQGSDFFNIGFLNTLNEIQFLLYEVEMNQATPKELAELLNSGFRRRHNSKESHESLFFQGAKLERPTYDQILFNLSHDVEDAHLFLINKILYKFDYLKKDGFLFIYSNQRLFQKRYKKRVSKLLEETRLVGLFDFSSLSSKGELPQYLYVLSHKNKANSRSTQSFIRFKLKGQLKSFYQFEEVNQFFNQIFLKKEKRLPSVIYKRFNDDLSISINHEHVLDGDILKSSESAEFTTHPQFSKNLASSCTHFDHFFKVNVIRPSYQSFYNGESDDLFSQQIFEEKYDYFLSYKESRSFPIIQIYPISAFASFVEEKGFKNFKFFGLRAKHKLLPINTFQELFSSSFGRQLMMLSYSSEMTPKSFIENIYIPRSFISISPISLELEDDVNNLLKIDDLDKLTIEYRKTKSVIATCSRNQKASTVQVLSNLKKFLLKNKEEADPIQSLEFLKKVAILEKHKLIEHPDLYTYFEAAYSPDQVLSSQKVTEENGVAKVSLYSEDELLGYISGPASLIRFTAYFLEMTIDKTFKQAIQGISVPLYSPYQVQLDRYQRNSLQKKQLIQLINADINYLIKTSL